MNRKGRRLCGFAGFSLAFWDCRVKGGDAAIEECTADRFRIEANKLIAVSRR
jgi:hypothetical protein